MEAVTTEMSSETWIFAMRSGSVMFLVQWADIWTQIVVTVAENALVMMENVVSMMMISTKNIETGASYVRFERGKFAHAAGTIPESSNKRRDRGKRTSIT
jgi:hypothetical protein